MGVYHGASSHNILSMLTRGKPIADGGKSCCDILLALWILNGPSFSLIVTIFLLFVTFPVNGFIKLYFKMKKLCIKRLTQLIVTSARSVNRIVRKIDHLYSILGAMIV